MRSKQYFTSIENNPHENSTEPQTLEPELFTDGKTLDEWLNEW